MILIFDCETSGVPDKGQYDNPAHKNTPRLVELGALLYTDNQKRYGRLELIIKPDGFEIPKAASDVHGITTERALNEGIPLSEAMSRFEKMIDLCHTVVAHNFSYDYLVYRGECLKLNLPDKLKDKHKICTKELTTDICKIPALYGYGYKWPTLQEAHVKLFGYEFSGAHGAIADITACAKIYFEVLNNYAIKS